MREQILKLCRRLDKFTIDNLLMITEMETEELMPIVRELLAEGKISESNGQYSYCKKVSVMQKYSIFSYYSSSVVDTIIRCFCLDIPSYKTSQLLAIGEKQADKFYNIFRAELYEKQTKKLKSFYIRNHKLQEIECFLIQNSIFIFMKIKE